MSYLTKIHAHYHFLIHHKSFFTSEVFLALKQGCFEPDLSASLLSPLRTYTVAQGSQVLIADHAASPSAVGV